MAPGAPLEPGTRVADLRIESVLGRGASATVYRAVDQQRQTVALKLRPLGDPSLDRRFLREFESLRRLRLPGVVQVHNAGVTSRFIWYTMEVVHGHSLRRWINSGEDLDARLERACTAGARLADAVAGIHDAGFVHRDLKPSNVLVTTGGEPRVLDFGVVSWWAVGETLTNTGGLVGTPSFMSPEQVAGLPVTGFTDVFAIGLMLYEGVLGRRPSPDSPHGWLLSQCLQRTQPMVCRAPRVPRAFSALIDRCLTLEPTARPTARELGQLLQGVLTGSSGMDWPEPWIFQSRRPELRLLDEAVQGHGPRMVIVSGPAGSGRRRLVEQARRRALLRGVRSESGRCRLDHPGSAIGDILGSLLAAPAREEWRARVGAEDAGVLLEMWPNLPLQAISTPRDGEKASRKDVVAAATRALLRAAGSTGLVLTLLDFEEVDTLTARILDKLLNITDDNITLYAVLDDRWHTDRSRRSVEAARKSGEGQVLTLAPLDEVSCSRIAQALIPSGYTLNAPAGGPLPAVQVGLRELARLREEPFHPLSAQATGLAILDGPLPAKVLQAYIGDLDPLIEQGFVHRTRDGMMDVAGPSFQKAANARLTHKSRAHDRLADAWQMHGGSQLDWLEVARHRLRGEGGPKVWTSAVQAALVAERTGRYAIARRWLLLLDTLDKDRSSAAYKQLRFSLAWCRARVAHMTETERPRQDLVDAADARARHPADKALCALLRAELEKRQGRLERAAQEASRSAETFAKQAPEAAVRLWNEAGDCWLSAGEAARAQRCHDRAVELLPRVTDAFLPIETEVLNARLLLHEDRLLEARRACEDARDASVLLRYPRGEAFHARTQAEALLRLGQRREAEDCSRDARNLFVEHGHRAGAAAANVQLARLAVGRGELAAGRLLLDEALSTARKLHLRRLMPEALSVALMLAVLEDDQTNAEQVRQEYLSLRSHHDDWSVAQLVWRRSQGDLSAVERLARETPPRGYVAARAQLELARARLAAGQNEAANEALMEGHKLANQASLQELQLYARVIAGGVAPLTQRRWEDVVKACNRASWVELFLGVLEFDGRLRRAAQDESGAIASFRALHRRAADLGHSGYVRTATTLMGA